MAPIKNDTNYIDRPGAYGLVLDRKGKLAIIDVDGEFFLPGGGLQENETPEQCLKRELLEEMGCKITRYEYMGKADDHIYSEKDQKYYCIKGTYFRILDYEITNQQNDFTHIVRWMKPQEVVAKMNRDAQKRVVKKII